jgi:hypothetical protein
LTMSRSVLQRLFPASINIEAFGPLESSHPGPSRDLSARVRSILVSPPVNRQFFTVATQTEDTSHDSDMPAAALACHQPPISPDDQVLTILHPQSPVRILAALQPVPLLEFPLPFPSSVISAVSVLLP